MNKARCKKCGKVVEGYNKNHAEFLLAQHNLKHRGEPSPVKDQGDASNNQTNDVKGGDE